MALEQRLLALTGEGHVHRGTGVAEAQVEDGHPQRSAGDDDRRLAEVDLGLGAGRVALRHADQHTVRAELTADRSHVTPDGRLGHACAVLIEEALPDPTRGVTLLARCGQIVAQPAPNGGAVRVDGRRRALDDAAWRRQCRVERLAHGAAMHAVPASKCADRHLFLPALCADNLEQLHLRQLLLPRSADLGRSAESRDWFGRGWGHCR